MHVKTESEQRPVHPTLLAKKQTFRKNEKIYMFRHNTSQAANNMQLGNKTAADEGRLKVGMKGMILYKSNIIQKHSRGRGKEILQLADP